MFLLALFLRITAGHVNIKEKKKQVHFWLQRPTSVSIIPLSVISFISVTFRGLDAQNIYQWKSTPLHTIHVHRFELGPFGFQDLLDFFFLVCEAFERWWWQPEAWIEGPTNSKSTSRASSHLQEYSPRTRRARSWKVPQILWKVPAMIKYTAKKKEKNFPLCWPHAVSAGSKWKQG